MMSSKNPKSIRTSLIVFLGLAMVLVSVVMTYIIGQTVLTNNKEQISTSIKTQTEKRAYVLESQIKANVSASEAIAGMLGGLWPVPAKQRRASAEQSLRAMVKSSTIKSAWAYWLPEMFDDKDNIYADPEDNPTGQFKIHYIKDKNDRIKNDIISEFSPEQIENATNSDYTFIGEPVKTFIDGDLVFSAKVFTPIINSIGQNSGVAGVDIVLSGLDELMDGSSIFKDTVCQFITGSGNILAASDGSNPGEKSKLFTDSQLHSYFQIIDEETGEANIDTVTFTYIRQNQPTFVSVAKTLVDQTGNYWYFVSMTPEKSINQTALKTIWIIITAFILQIIIVMVTVYGIVTGFTNPLRKSVQALKNISEGDGDLTIRLHTTQKNEIGDMCHSFNKTMDKLSTSIKDVKDSSIQMESIGDELNQSMSKTSEAVIDITDGISSIQEQMQEHAAGVEEARSVVGQIVSNIELLNKNIDEQAASVTQSSSSIEQMTANIRSVSSILQNNKTSMDSLEQASDLGRSLVDNTAQLSERIQDRSKHLQEASAVIRNIASQTNLLAMNAAIEAAHAGDKGQGFTVVADEIRKLAEESGSQGSKIQSELKEVQDIINEVTESTKLVQNQFQTIFALTKTVSEQELIINEAMAQQNEGGTQIMEAIRHINQITQDVKNGSAQMFEGSKQVSIEMDGLAEMTNAVNTNVVNMNEKTSAIKDYASKAQSCVEKNVDSISKLRSAMNKFKVE